MNARILIIAIVTAVCLALHTLYLFETREIAERAMEIAAKKDLPDTIIVETKYLDMVVIDEGVDLAVKNSANKRKK